ncbi:SIMPL domain-containing protein [Sphingopyxis yananensis]|uniref:SIMPL domain-containing protein n=1 Tax=Sphingopyxis yananensis TaxID=2886687 RepID=UPI001D11A107|nr:SIMPL domain-containing protein [Sphingopyxis yananensis]MCC2603383.1 SIMPL domain-containing protein [Sphingopyxis yananensis]
MNKWMMAALVAGTAMAAQTPAMAQQTRGAAMMQSEQQPLVSFSVSEEVRSRPDVAGVGAGVEVTAPTAVEAMRQNAAAMDKLIAAVKAAGIKAEDIRTTGINLSSQYDYSNRQDGQPPRFVGYQVSNNVQVTTTKIDEIGALLDRLVAAGGTNVSGPWFSVKDAEAQTASIRGKVMAAGKAKAEDYARLAGYRSVELVSVSEGGGYVPSPRMEMVKMAAPADANSTPVEPGQVGNSLSLNFTYRLVK